MTYGDRQTTEVIIFAATSSNPCKCHLDKHTTTSVFKQAIKAQGFKISIKLT